MEVLKTIGVIGAGSCDEMTATMAFDIGKGIAEAGTPWCAGPGRRDGGGVPGRARGGGVTIGSFPATRSRGQINL